MKNYYELKSVFTQLSHLHYIHRLTMWDEAVMMPEGAGTYRAESLATLNKLTHKMLTSKKVSQLIDLSKSETLADFDKENLRLIEKKHRNAKCISSNLTEKYTTTMLATSQAWRQLRPLNDWESFYPSLNKLFNIVKEISYRKADVFQTNPYDVLIDEYSPGFNQANIDPIFQRLKMEIPELRKKIVKQQSHIKLLSLPAPVFKETQKEICMFFMNFFQFDFHHGRLDESMHPMCDGIAVDTRITNHYNEDNLLESIFNVCHEVGHGLYEQNVSIESISQPAGQIQSKAMHESQSLLLENIVCHSLPFMQLLSKKIVNIVGFNEAYSTQNLYNVSSQVKGSLIRLHADEVSYPLHIIMRYEIEKALFNDDICIKDLPAYWDDLMLKYLGGSSNDNHKNGVMQDIHWSIGYFGYFPAYTLGQLISAQLFSSFINEHPDFFANLAAGEPSQIINWLKNNVHKYASSLSTHDLLKKVTGSQLDASYFINDIKSRYL